MGIENDNSLNSSGIKRKADNLKNASSESDEEAGEIL
ncbi:unnamed protein product, partial [Brachionus calyciflorus]